MFFGYDINNHGEEKVLTARCLYGDLHHNVILWVHIWFSRQAVLDPDLVFFDLARAHSSGSGFAVLRGHEVILRSRITRRNLNLRNVANCFCQDSISEGNPEGRDLTNEAEGNMKPRSISVFGQPMVSNSSQPNRPRGGVRSVVQRLPQRLLIVFLSIGLIGVSSWAQGAGGTHSGTAQAQEGKGTVSGRATDPGHDALQGARLELQPKGLTAVSDSQGQFTISDVPAGNYTLTVSYIGFSQFSAPVSVTAGGTAQVDALLQIESVSQQVLVRGERERGEVEALNRERTADTIVQVLPAEVITSLPNTNVADALGRLPSVSLERDEGEGKYVQIRGTEPRLSNVTINGVHVSSPENDVRNVKLDVIPADLVESIEVSKTLSANQDGDAIGGSINLVTRTADDEPFYSLSGIYGYTPIINGRSLTQYGATIGRRFGAEKRLGAVFGGSYDYNGRGFNNIEPAPGTNDFLDGRGPVPVYTGIHLREYQYRRNRYGFAGSLDYRLSNGSSAYVRGLFSEFKDFGDTWNTELNLNLLTPTTSDAFGFVQLRHLNRTPQQRIYSITAGEKLNLGHYFMDYQFAVSRSRQDGQFPSTYFRSPTIVAFGVDTSNPLTPKFPVLNGININDASLYSFTKTILADDHVRELDLEGAISLARHYFAGSHFGSFEVGAKIRNGHKTNRTFEPVYTATGTPVLNYSQVLGNAPKDPGFYFGQYTLPPFSDYNKIQALLAANPGALALDVDSTHGRSDPNNYITTERIYAVYAMNTITFGRARLQTGVRIETTQSNFTGYHVTFGTVPDANGFLYQSTTPVLGDNLYASVLPSVQFQYAITPNTNLRAAYGMGIARPRFADLPPSIVENDQGPGQSVTVGNPALRPTKANNYDLLAERYLKPVGLIQAGVFYKELSDPIFGVTTLLTSGPFAGFTQFQPINGKSAHIFGVETTYQQQLTFLPGLMSGLGVSANYSYTTSRATVPQRAIDPALIRQGPNNWNVDVTYDKRRVSARLGLTHNDAYIYLYTFADGTDGGVKGPNGDQYTYAHTQLDIQGSYRLHGGLKFIVSLLNLNNEVFGFYQGSTQYPIQREFYGPTFMFGFRWANSKER
jgi:TonB-dependent receptor